MHNSQFGKKTLGILVIFVFAGSMFFPLDSNNYLAEVNAALVPIGSGAILQGFYWDVPYDWYQTVYTYIPQIAAAGFDNIWLPPPSKAMGGRDSMGYDPYDYYDLGEYYQKGSVATRFGTKADLLSLINLAKSYGLHVTADIVINHNGGGDLEWNPNVNDYTWTDFTGVASGKFLRSYNDFHPSTYEQADEGVFGGYPDLAHANPYVWNEVIKWGQWLRDSIGFTDWRFDYVKGYHAWMVRDWLTYVGGFGVGEYWDTSISTIQNWLSGTDWKASAFDFPLYYTLRDMSEGGGLFYMGNLAYAGLAGSNPFNAVTFVANHDTNEIYTMKEMAYAYILLSEGYPSVFWRDYFEWGFKDAIDLLLSLRKQYAGGTTSVLLGNDDLFIMQRNGYGSQPGLILMMNDGDTWKGAWVQTKWSNQLLRDATGRAYDEWVDGNGWVEIWAPPRSYTVWIPV